MAVKTILIGMGSFGHDVCEILASRIEAEFGSLSCVPWVKFVVYETEQQTQSLLARKNLVKHMGVDSSSWESYLGNPGNFDPSIEFTKWADSSLRDVLRDGGIPTHGANNTRVTGRLCFLDIKNLPIFHAEFRRAYDELTTLTVADAMKALGREEDPIRFAHQGADGPDTIQVFIIGSLSGGTNSGCFIDVAYYLRTWEGISSELDVQGLFVIPDPSYENKVHWGNVYAGLTELNHYMSGKPYQAKFATRSSESKSVSQPFSRVYLVQSLSGSANPSASLEPIQHSLAGVLHLNSIEDPQDKVLNTLVNPIGVYAGERDHDGRAMNYLSIGASVVLFPVEHILSGLSAKLCLDSFSQILQRSTPSTKEVKGFAASLQVDEETYSKRMVAHPTIENYLAKLGEETQRAATEALKGDTSTTENISVRIKNGIAIASQGSTQNFQGEFRNPIYEVSTQLAHERIKELDRRLAEMLANPARGLYWTEAMLAGFITQAEKRLGDLTNPNTDVGHYVEATAAEDTAKDAERKMSEKPGCNPFVKKPDKKALSAIWVNNMKRHWEASLLIQSGEFEKRALEQLLERAKLIKGRLSHPSNGLIQFLGSMKDEFAKRYEDLDKAGPPVHGLCLFEPRKTLQEEWSKCLHNAESARTASSIVLKACNVLFNDIFNDRNLSSFDRTKRPGWQEIEQFLKVGREPFQFVKADNVERRLMAWPNWQLELRKAADLGKSLIKIDASRNQLGIPTTHDNMRRPAISYFHDPTSKAGETGSVNEILAQSRTPVVAWSDRHRIMFTEGLAIFAPYSIFGVPSAEVEYTQKRRTRSDVAWQKLNGKPLDPHERYSIGLILTAAALGIVKSSPPETLSFSIRESNLYNAQKIDLCKNLDLADASYRLGLDQVAAKDLREQTESEIRRLGPSEAARLITLFNSGAKDWKLVVGSVLIDKREAYLGELIFVKSIPGLFNAISEKDANLDPKSGNWILAAGSLDRPAAFRCNRCGQFLAAQSNANAPDDLPEVCPNPNCGQQIRYDILLGLTS